MVFPCVVWHTFHIFIVLLKFVRHPNTQRLEVTVAHLVGWAQKAVLRLVLSCLHFISGSNRFYISLLWMKIWQIVIFVALSFTNGPNSQSRFSFFFLLASLISSWQKLFIYDMKCLSLGVKFLPHFDLFVAPQCPSHSMQCSVYFLLLYATEIFILNLLSWTVMNVSLDTLHNSAWSDYFVGSCCSFLHQYAFAKLCLSLSEPCQTCSRVASTVKATWSQFDSVYSVNVCLFFLQSFFELNVFWFLKNKIRVTFWDFSCPLFLFN